MSTQLNFDQLRFPNSTGVLKTNILVSTAVTADQVILTYTVTSGKTFFLQCVSVSAYRTAIPGNANPLVLGEVSLETPSGTKVMGMPFFHPPTPFIAPMDLPIPSGTVIRLVVTPSATTSTTWVGNLSGYEV